MAALELRVCDIVAVAQKVACVLRSTPHRAGLDEAVLHTSFPAVQAKQHSPLQT